MVSIKNISPAIDGCAGLISQQAYRAFTRLSKEHKRWVDPEDMLQTALMEAVRAERRYKVDKGAKYSTYLTRGLFNELSKATDKLRQQKRVTRLIELDAPVYDDAAIKLEVPDKGELADEGYFKVKRAIYGLEQLCRAVSPRVRLIVVRGLLFAKHIRPSEVVELQEARLAAAKIGLRWVDLEVFSEDEKSRQMALTQLLSSGTVGSGDSDARLLECGECEGQFSLSDVRAGRYFVSTSTCRTCYRKLRADPDRCFGREKTDQHEGYAESDVECRLHCRDRKVCGQFISRKEIAMKDEELEASAELEGVDLEDKPKKSKSGKVAKAAKKVKEPKEDENPAPAEIGGVWPFRANSHMLWLFQAGIEKSGIKLAEAIKILKQANAPHPEAIVKSVRAGRNNVKSGNTTHTWKINEEGGGFKIYEVKYLGKSEKMEKIRKPKAEKTEKPAKVAKAEKPAKVAKVAKAKKPAKVAKAKAA